MTASLKAVNAKLKKGRQKRRRLDKRAGGSTDTPVAKPKPGDACPWWRPALATVYQTAPREQPGATWDTLILPPFETGGMVRRKQPNGLPRKLHSKVARSLMSWRHYDFGVHVKNVFLRAGKEVVSPDERYTTMNCGVCGVLNDKHSNEQWTCKHCGAFHLRDPAASRCIFLKALVPVQPSIGDAVQGGEIQPTHHQAYDASGSHTDRSSEAGRMCELDSRV